MKENYKGTIYACFMGYIVQAIINNFVPLLFLTFHSSYGIPMGKITFLITFNFGIQLLVDLLAAKLVDRIGYRISMVAADVFAAAGLLSLAILPDLFPDPFAGLLTAVVLYALGGGLLEVLVSPIVEACPSDNKEAAMSLLHSFYCWGHVAVALFSTLFFAVFGIRNWKIMAALWALVPVFNGILFTRVPIAKLLDEDDAGMTIRQLLGSGRFWLLAVLMVCSGASEQAVSQWTSAFAEQGLGISKTVGDLAGTMAFAVLMGTARALYGKFGNRMDLKRTILGSSLLCIFAYVLIVVSSWPLVSLIGCGLTGFAVGVLWPGTFSMSSAAIPRGGTAMFAFLALAGDLGCSFGPTVVGRVSGMFGDNLKTGILAATVFPTVMSLGVLCLKRRHSGTIS